MDQNESYKLLIECIESIKPGSGSLITMNTDLIEDGILDSLDAMTFIFKLEKRTGTKIKNIHEGSVDLSVESLVRGLSEL